MNEFRFAEKRTKTKIKSKIFYEPFHHFHYDFHHYDHIEPIVKETPIYRPNFNFAYPAPYVEAGAKFLDYGIVHDHHVLPHEHFQDPHDMNPNPLYGDHGHFAGSSGGHVHLANHVQGHYPGEYEDPHHGAWGGYPIPHAPFPEHADHLAKKRSKEVKKAVHFRLKQKKQQNYQLPITLFNKELNDISFELHRILEKKNIESITTQDPMKPNRSN